jgi:HlyD family secretion protein
MTRRGRALCLVALLLAACDAPPEPTFQGYMEADLLLVGPDEGGRLVSLAVDEGAAVAQGAALFTVDPSLFRTQADEAAGRLAEARARLANLRAQQQRPEEIAVLAARRSQAEAAMQLAARELNRQRALFDRGIVARARLDQAEAAARESRAALQEVERQIQAGRLTARVQEIAAAQAAIATAEAALAEAQVRLERRSVAAPVSGTVQQVLYRPGEMVPAAQPIVALLPLERLRVRFFVPETLLSRVRLGQAVAVGCDGCRPDLRARIAFVSREAEFTPPVIFGPTERAKLVFLVEAVPEGETASLLPGQPVTVSPVELAGAP